MPAIYKESKTCVILFQNLHLFKARCTANDEWNANTASVGKISHLI